MQTISCDVCRKKLDNPMGGRSFFHLGEHNICEPCRDELDLSIRPQIRGQDPYTVDWYDNLVNNTLVKAIQKGKI